MAKKVRKIMPNVRDLAFVCRRCYPEKTGYLRLTLEEISEWRASPDRATARTCDQGHLIGRDTILCYFRVDMDGNTLDPRHEAWTSGRRD